MSEHKEWTVELVAVTEHIYTVLARTAEEAVSIAEDLLDSGDEGTITSTSIESGEAATGGDFAFVEEDDLPIEFANEEDIVWIG